MYRYTKLEVAVADDSNLRQKEVDRTAIFYQALDQKSFNQVWRVAPGDSAKTITFSANITTPYFLCVLSDYPVIVGCNGGTFTMVSNNVATTNLGAPLPDMCAFMTTSTISALTLTPVSGASQTANVKVIMSGDPISAYV